MKRRLFSVILAITILLTTIDVSVFAAQVSEEKGGGITVSENDISDFEEGDINEEIVEENATSVISTGNALVDAIISYAKNQTHSSAWSGYCQAFVKSCYEAAGIKASQNASTAIEAKKWWRVSNDLTQIPIGACVYWYDNHVAIYLGNDRIIHTVKGVYKDGDPNISYVEETSLSYYTKQGKVECWGYQAGYDLYSGGNIEPTSIYTSVAATNITETSAKIVAKLNKTYDNIPECGFYIGTSSTNMEKVYENNKKEDNTIKPTNSINYTLGNGSKWMPTLEKGTTYYYQFYAIINDVEHKSEICTFTTLGNAYHNPRGNVEVISGGEASITIGGWVIDDDEPDAPLSIHVYVGGPAGSGVPCYVFSADKYGSDVGNHRFSETFYTDKTGNVDVYIYAINAGGGTDNPQIGWGTAVVSADITKPTITNAYIKDVTRDGYTVVAEVKDNVGIQRVRFPTRRRDTDAWNWYEGIKVNEGIYEYRVNVQEYDNYEGMYDTHIYAYDYVGNTSSIGVAQYVDRTNPVISNVKFDRISADTVRVSCQVTDDSKITKVSFPTWTRYNNQDDMKEPWVDHYDGTKNGSTYTYIFKDSEHNYERGDYAVHIYAWDEFGNTTRFTTEDYNFQNLYNVISSCNDGHRYELYDDILTWQEAKEKCEELGGHLVTITSEEEQSIVNELMSEGGRVGYFIGGQLQNGEMAWITGERFDYTNWDPGEPNNYDGIENVCMMYKRGTWNDTNESDIKHGFICEYESTSYTINFDKNSAEATGTMQAQKVEAGKTVLLSENQFQRVGYNFAGWNTKADGTGTTYQDRAGVSEAIFGNETSITLYAQWKEISRTSTPYANIASGSQVKEGTELILLCEDKSAEIYYTTDNTEPTRESILYTQPIIINENTTIRAIAFKDGYQGSEVVTFSYTIAPKVIYTIHFDKNSDEATGTMPVQSEEEGSTALLMENRFERAGYTFAGWNTKADGTGTAYADRTGVVRIAFGEETSITLYAQWERVSQVSAPYANIASESTVEKGTKLVLSCADEGVEIYYTTDNTEPTKESLLYTQPIILNEDITIKAAAFKERYETSETIVLFYTVVEEDVIYTITFDKNSDEAIGEMPQQSLAKDGFIWLQENAFVWDGYLFTGWNTQADGSGTSYRDGAVLFGSDMGEETSITLYAQWKKMEKLEAPYANVATGSTVRKGTEVVLEHAASGVQIFYTTDNTIPTKESQRYVEPFIITEDIDIMAIAVKEEYKTSEPVGFSYRVAETGEILPEDIPEDGIREVPEGLWIAGIDSEGYTYTGKAIKPEVRVYDHTTLLEEKKDYTISYSRNVNANDAGDVKKAPTITVKGKGNYSGKETAVFKINSRDISIEENNILVYDISAAYNKKLQKPVPVVYDNGKKLKNKTHYTVEYVGLSSDTNAFKEVGQYKICILGKGNYTGTREIDFFITDSILISKASVSKISNQIYDDGNEVKPTVTVKYKGKTLEENTDYTVFYENNRNVGKATAVIQGINEFTGEKRVNFNITAVSIKKVEMHGYFSKDIVYTGKQITLQDIVSRDTQNIFYANGEYLTEGKDYTVRYEKNINIGTASVIFTGINGYSGTVKKTFKILPYDIWSDSKLKISVLLEPVVSYEKGGAKPDITIMFGNRVLKEKVDYTLTCKNNNLVDDDDIYEGKIPEVTIRGKGNFKGQFTKQYSIVRKDISALEMTLKDVAFKKKANAYKVVPKIMDTNNKALTANTDYEKAVIYSYGTTTILDDGIVRQAGETVGAKDIVPAGTVICVTANGKGKYKGTLTDEYRVVSQDISKAKVVIPAQTYTGKDIILEKDKIKVTFGKEELETTDYEIVGYQNNTKKGTAKVTLKGVDNYGGTKTVSFKINSKPFFWWKKE